MSDEGLFIDFEFRGNPEELAAQMANAMTQAFGRAIAEIQSDLTKLFTARGRANQGAASRLAQEQARQQTRVTESIRDSQRAAQDFAKTLTGMRTQPFFGRMEESFENVENDLERLRVLLQQVGQGRGTQDQLQEIARLSTRVFEQTALNARRASNEQEQQFRKAAEAARVAEQGITARVRAETSERIVLAQQEGARVAAETRAAGQRRLATMQFFFAQIRALERGLGAVFRGTSSAIGGTVRGIGASLSRLGGLFRRADREIGAGLAPSLNRRETILRSSMSRQERILASSVQRQSIQVQRLENRLSRGVLGAASGRSGLGALLGGGLAIGGGFAIISKLRDLATAGADTTQALAVLQAQLRLNDRQMARVRDTAIDLGNDISLPGVSAKDATEAIQLLVKQFGSLGKQAVPAARNAAKGVLQLSRATQSDAAASAQVVGAAVNVFGVAADKATDVADQITGALTVAAGTSFDDFAAAFRQGATVFSQFQTPVLGAEGALVEFNTALAALARGGLVGSDAGTALRAFFLQANRGTAEAKENLALLADRAGVVGSVFFDAEGNARSLTDALDIMRRGLDGMSDQERSQALQKIFGTDAIRAAELLTKTSTESFEEIRKGIQREGIAAEIAAAQNTGLRGAMDALNSVIETQAILAYEKLNIVVGNVVLQFAELLQQLFTGEGAWKLLRQAIVGATAGLAGFLALRASVELLQLLGTVARGLLTPFGLIVLAFVGLGAAFNLLRENSPGFNRAMGRILEVLRGLADVILIALDPAIEFLREQFRRFIRFVTGGAETLAEFGTVVGEAMLAGVTAAAEFIENRVIPAIRSFITFVREEVIPAVGRFFVRAWNAARDAVVSFWNAVEPVVRPAIDGFRRIGESLRDLTNFDTGTLLRIGGVLAAALAGFAVGGPIGGLVAGSASAIALLFGDTLGRGLLDTLGNIGGLIRDALSGPLSAAAEFIGSFFTADRLEAVVRGFLDVIERIGFIIGNIATDPRVAAAIAALGAAGVVMAARFVQGFARGVIDNFGDIFDTFVNQVIGIEGDFERVGRDLGLALVVGITGVFIGGRLLGGLRTALTTLGITAGRQFGQAIKQGTDQALTVGGAGLGAGPRGLIQGLFGDRGAAVRDANRISRAVVGEFDRNLRVLRAAGADTSGALNAMFTKGVGDGLRASRSAIRNLEAQLGTARVAGLGARDAMRQIGTAIRVVDFRGVTQGISDLRASLSGQGRNIGAAVGTAIASSIGVAFGARMAIESDNAADLLVGLGTVLGSVAASFAVGGPILAGITAGLGAITTLFQLNQGAAEKARREVEEYQGALESVGAAAQRQSIETALFENLKEESAEARTLLDELGFQVGDFTDELLRGEGAGRRYLAALLEGLGTAQPQLIENLRSGAITLNDLEDTLGRIPGPAFGVQKALERAGIGGDALGAILDFLNDEAGEFGTAASDAALNARLLGTDLEAAGVSGATAMEAIRSAAVDRLPAVNAAAQDTADELDLIGEAAEAARETIDTVFGRGVPRTLQEAIDEFVIGLRDLPRELEGINLGRAIGKAQVREAARDKAGEILAALNQGVADGVITTVPELRVQRRQLIQQVREKLERTGGELDEVEVAFLANLRAIVNEETSSQQIRDALEALRLEQLTIEQPVEVLAIPSMDLSDFQEKITESFSGPGGFGGGAGRGNAASLRGAGGPTVDVPITINPQISVGGGSQTDIGTGIAATIAAGITSAAPQISNALASAVGGALRTSTALASAFVAVGVRAAQAFAQGVIAGAGAATSAAAALGVAATRSAASGSSAMSQVGSAAALAYAFGIVASAGAASSASFSMAANAASAAGGPSAFGSGQSLAFGFAAGISSGASAAISAAIRMANAAIAAARAALQISSPSRVFQELGREIGRGLARGIRDGETDINSAINDAVDKALETARQAIPERGALRAGASASLFEALQPAGIPGGPTALDVHRTLLQTLDAIQAVRDIEIERNQENAELNKQIAELKTELSTRLVEIRDDFRENVAKAFARPEGGLDIVRQRINLGGLGGQLRTAFADILRDARDKAAETARKAAEPGATDAERRAARAAADRLRTLEAQARSLNANTAAGRAAANVILDFGQQIRDLGSSMLQQGASADSVIRTMTRYRDQLVAQAQSLGINRGALRDLLQQLGLTDAQLRRFGNASRNAADRAREATERARASTAERVRSLQAEILANTNASRSLSQATEAGRQNRQVFLDAFQGVRQFGVELLQSGVSADEAVRQMQSMRNSIVDMARRMGFSSAEITELLRMLGLTDEQLREFIRHLGDLNDELETPTPGPPGTLPGPLAPVVNIFPPYGDPEAIGLATVNRLAMGI